MADTASIAIGSSDYLGSAALGGAGELAINIDTKPIQQLAQYTYLYNKSQYDQRQKDADEKIKQLAALTAYDLVNGRGKDKQAVIDAQADLTNYMADFAAKGTPKSPKEKINQQLEFQKKINDSIKIINGANERAIGYSVQKAGIEKDDTLNASQKENLIKNLDKTFDDTDIYTPIPALPKFKAPNTDAGTASMKETAVIKVGDNGFTEEKVKIFDPKSTMNDAFLVSESLRLPALPANATPLQKQEYEQRVLAGDANTVWQQAAQNYAAALNDPNYKKTVEVSDINITGTPASTTVTDEVDIEKIKGSNPIVGGILNLVDRYNAYAIQMKEQANTVYTDETGKSIKLLPAVNADDYFIIDKTQPLTPAQIVFLEKFAKAAPDKLEKNYVNTDAQLKRAQLQETIRNNKADQYLKGKEIKLNEDKWKASQVGGEKQINGAMERAKKIYQDLVKLGDANGVISPDKLRQLNVEQLKYLGIEAPQQRDENGKIVDAGGFKPLAFTVPNTAIQLVNGNIKVLENTKRLDDGRYTGEFNNTKSTNLRNVATNILNEELKTAGSKELNSYMGVDVIEGVVSNTSGGSTSSSGSTKQTSSTPNMDYYNNSANVKSESGNTITYKDGTVWVYDAKKGTLTPKKQ